MTCLECTLHTSRVVALLERVQGGIIGQTLSSFGITGLYITFVFGIGRFLRFSTQHARMRIPFEDLPTTKRLIALCQVYALRALPTPAVLLRSHPGLPAYPAAVRSCMCVMHCGHQHLLAPPAFRFLPLDPFAESVHVQLQALP